MTLTTNLAVIEESEHICQALMRLPHYAKIGRDGITAIVAKAQSLKIDPLDALNGGLYSLHGKVEMTSQMMNQLIRQAGHSVRKDARSDDNVCILIGKRADTGDDWCESFSIEEAKRAGIYKEQGTWGKYPRDMLFARALSRLARQLFPDVIKGCYVKGELSEEDEYEIETIQSKPEIITISAEEAEELEILLNKVPDYKERALKWIAETHKIHSLQYLTPKIYAGIKSYALKKIESLKNLELVESNETERTA